MIKYLFTLIVFVNTTGSLFCQSDKSISFLVTNKEEFIKDTIRMVISNYKREQINYVVAIEVYDENKWQELYGNIFEFNRDVIRSIKVLAKQKRELHFSVKRISVDYQKILSGKPFRLVLHVFPKQPLKGVYTIVSNSFKIEW